ncbi:hypothetical protein THAOC_11324, partial [Thalassiosira oceanica]
TIFLGDKVLPPPSIARHAGFRSTSSTSRSGLSGKDNHGQKTTARHAAAYQISSTPVL